MKFGCTIVFFYFGIQFAKCKKNVEESFSAVECLIIKKLIKAEMVIAFHSDIFVLCCNGIYYQFDDLIDEEFVDCVDETNGCLRVICINNLLTMSDPPPTKCERFLSDVIYFDEV